ncbi:TPA: four helix bundle protein [archaeon]|nr:four helix bundle protein [Candidatus Naiadarchaeales archaeon SRR2090153.bin461]
MQDYRNLEIYKKAYELTKNIYKLTFKWPAHELYGLTAQIRRSAHSIDSNICEGSSRGSDPDRLRFMYGAYSSLKETENHLKLSFDLGYTPDADYKIYEEKLDHLSRMLNNFMSRLKH